MSDEELKKLLEQTTPAPWRASFGTWPDQRRFWVEGPGYRVVQGPDSMPDAMAEANARFIAHAREVLPSLAAETAALKAQLVAMDAKLLDANPEIARLRKLIKDGCKAGEDLDECPWCIMLHSEERNQRARRLGFANGAAVHALDCPAFKLDGTVR